MSAVNFLALGTAPAPMDSSTVAFGEWLPDMPDRDNPGAIEALNVLPSAGGSYSPFPQLITDPIMVGKVTGSIVALDKNSEDQLYAADKFGVYLRVFNVFETRLVLSPAISEKPYWQFVVYGDNIVALHKDVFPHVDVIGGPGPFTLLGGNPPKAVCGSRVGDFLVLGNLITDPDDTVEPGPFPRRIRWSGFNDIEAPWVTDPATQADFNDMPAEGGRVVGITGRETGTIFQERMISRMSYVGLPTVFDISTVEAERGALNGGCIVDIGGNVFFIANDGFFMWNGTEATPIGDSKVNRWFFSKLNYNEKELIVGAVDYFHGCVVWAFPAGTSVQLTSLIVFSYRMNRWSHCEINMEYLINGTSANVSLDYFTGVSLDDPIAWPVTLDFLIGGRPVLAAYDMTHAYGVFNGGPMEATIDTAESSGPDGERWFINSVRPAVDVQSPSLTVQMIWRDQLMGGALNFDPFVPQEITGECPVLTDARYMRVRVKIPKNTVWSTARGVEIYRKSTGRV